MSKTLLTLVVMAAVSCGEGQRRDPAKFRTSLDLEAGGAQRTFLIGMDDPDPHRHEFGQIAVAGNFLYFNVPWSGVYRMPKYGGEVQPIEETRGVEDFGGIAINETDVYWARMSDFGSAGPDFPHSRLRRQALGGGAIQTVTEGDIGILDQWVTGASVFHAAADAVYGGVSYPQKDYVDLTRFPVDGGTSTVLWRLDESSEPVLPSYSVFDDLFAYVSSCDTFRATACALTRIDLRTGTMDKLPTTTEPQQVVAIDAKDLYLESAHQLLRRAKEGAGDPTVLASFGEIRRPMAVVDDDEIFLIVNGGTLVSVPKAGGPARILTTGLESATALAQDEQNLFVLYDWRLSIDLIPKTSAAALP